MAEYIRNNEVDFIKPIRVREDEGGRYKIDGGVMRYWAWKIAYNGNKKIPTIIIG